MQRDQLRRSRHGRLARIFREWRCDMGRRHPKGMKWVHAGDQIIAVQSDRHELVGVARVIGFVKDRGRRRIRLHPSESIGVKIPPLKKGSRAIAAIPALQGGPVATIYEISDTDAARLLEAARYAK